MKSLRTRYNNGDRSPEVVEAYRAYQRKMRKQSRPLGRPPMYPWEQWAFVEQYRPNETPYHCHHRVRRAVWYRTAKKGERWTTKRLPGQGIKVWRIA